jgi:hypothetical protein
VCTSALAEKVEEMLTLLGVETCLTASVAFGVKAAVAVLYHRITPPTDRRRRGVDMTRYLAAAPAGFKKGNRKTSTDFELDFGAFRSHEDLTGTTALSL